MRASYARYKCMGVLYYKLAAFIPNTKDIWDFCLGGFKIAQTDIDTLAPLIRILLESIAKNLLSH
ncbi:hypothetical protein [Helicobacter pylori]|uniref:hypothetical protein n=1 Tax=Helicobacter pylori TaxID=210 RepID=UPI00215A02BA|nr:hypothetical protein [Helicobacter pylori]